MGKLKLELKRDGRGEEDRIGGSGIGEWVRVKIRKGGRTGREEILRKEDGCR